MNSQSQHTSSDYIHGSSPEEQRRLSLLNELLNQASARELGLRGGERILDVGSGLGQFTRVMARTAGAGGRALGIERDHAQLAEANRLASKAGESELTEFRQGNALDLPLRSDEWGSFDLAHARFLLEHISDPMSVISQMVDAVRPGGRVVVADDDHGDFRPWPEPDGFHGIWQAYVRSYERKGNDPYIGRRLVFLLHEAGLCSIRNTCVFFGGCAGSETFMAVADNLISVLIGAKEDIVSGEFLDEASYFTSIDGLMRWKEDPSSALWYSLCWAEGSVPKDGA
ncbi:MAG: methyltransferase domain-containing protein [Gammaproteobacteria bacterium]|nr:methyltransferase domain-containing protein [Gammaproteobacteria bacterium]